jgi:hypothetical protein
MPRIAARDIDLIRVGEALRVAVCRDDPQHDSLAPANESVIEVDVRPLQPLVTGALAFCHRSDCHDELSRPREALKSKVEKSSSLRSLNQDSDDWTRYAAASLALG